jgi:hypothetical protein
MMSIRYRQVAVHHPTGQSLQLVCINLQAVGAPAALVRRARDVILQLRRECREIQEEVLCSADRREKHQHQASCLLVMQLLVVMRG